MATAKIKLKSGPIVTVEGTPDEIALILASVKNEEGRGVDRESAIHQSSRSKRGKGSIASPTDLLISLADGDFFKTPRDLGSIKLGLEEIGYKYPVTTISTLIRRLVRKRILRRFKEDNRWMYTNS